MKLPPQAKKVFTGQIFDVYHWEQEMYDGSFKTFERLKRTGTVDVIAVSGEKIFIALQSQPTEPNFYSLFGGRVEKDEKYLDTAKRELVEESGMISDSWELYKTFQPFHKIDYDVSLFIAKNCKKIGKQKLDAGEKIEIIECTFEEFIEIAMKDNFAQRELAFDILRMKVLELWRNLRKNFSNKVILNEVKDLCDKNPDRDSSLCSE